MAATAATACSEVVRNLAFADATGRRGCDVHAFRLNAGAGKAHLDGVARGDGFQS